MTIDLTVRAAVLDDAAGIARVHIQAWRETYTHLLPAEALAGLPQGPREATWREIIAAGTSNVWLACEGADILGWASAGDGQDDDGPRTTELFGIYVLAGSYGSGAGQLLLDAAVGDGGAYLWIADQNPRPGFLPAQRIRTCQCRQGTRTARHADPDSADGALSPTGAQWAPRWRTVRGRYAHGQSVAISSAS